LDWFVFAVKILTILGRLSKSNSAPQTLHSRSWKWWFRHYNGFNVKTFLWLKRLWCKNSYGV